MNLVAILYAILIMAGGVTLVGALVIVALAIPVRLVFGGPSEPDSAGEAD